MHEVPTACTVPLLLKLSTSDDLWDMFLEDHGNPDNNDEWETFVTNNAIDYLDTLIELDFTQ